MRKRRDTLRNNVLYLRRRSIRFRHEYVFGDGRRPERILHYRSIFDLWPRTENVRGIRKKNRLRDRSETKTVEFDFLADRGNSTAFFKMFYIFLKRSNSKIKYSSASILFAHAHQT